MLGRVVVTFAVSVLACLAAPIFSFAQANPAEVRKSKGGLTKGMVSKTGYAPGNGLKMSYEIHGEGKPLVLLHGSFMTIDLSFVQLITDVSTTRKLISIVLQDLRRTANIH